jgi:hypothetical protein
MMHQPSMTINELFPSMWRAVVIFCLNSP